MKTAIIGASGEIGARLAQAMMAEGEKVRAISRKKSPRLARWGDIDFVPLELPATKENLKQALHGCDAIVDCVVDKKPFESDDESIKSNVAGLKLLLETAMEQGVKKIIHLSSIAVLPPRLTRECVENPFRYSKEQDWYTRVKIAAEKTALAYNDRINLCVIRPGIVYGPYMHWSRLAFHRTQNFKVILPQVSNAVCHAIHVDDLSGFIRHLLKRDKLPQLVHAINGEIVTWKDFFEGHAHALGLHDEITGELMEQAIIAHHKALKLAEQGPGMGEKALASVRKLYNSLPDMLTQLKPMKMTVEAMKVMKRGLPFYMQLYLPPPKMTFYPNEFEKELFSSSAVFPPDFIGIDTGFTYGISLQEGTRSAAAWRNFEVTVF